MLYFFDTEFTGLHKDTSLISIGIVEDSGRKFYAELTDYDESQIDEWLSNNIIDKLLMNDKADGVYIIDDMTVHVKGEKNKVRDILTEWLVQSEPIQFVSDVCHYDFVLLIDIFGGAFDIPKNMSPTCIDLNQEIGRHLGISAYEAFDINREDCVGIEYDKENKHNALHDAIVIRDIYCKIFE